MTNKEAIMILESIQPSCGEKYQFSESEIYEAIDMAIEALESVTINAESDEIKVTNCNYKDIISRSATITEIKNYERDSTAPINYVRIVEHMPSAEPERDSCEGCVHMSQKYKYPLRTQCTNCIRNFPDNYESE